MPGSRTVTATSSASSRACSLLRGGLGLGTAEHRDRVAAAVVVGESDAFALWAEERGHGELFGRALALAVARHGGGKGAVAVVCPAGNLAGILGAREAVGGD